MCVSYPLWLVLYEIYKPEVGIQIIVNISPCGCIYYWNLQILNNLIILTDKVSLVPLWHPHLQILNNLIILTDKVSLVPRWHPNLQILNNIIILTDKVSLVPLWHPAHWGVYSIQHYVIKLVSDLQPVGGFSSVSYTNNTNHHDITEIF